MTNRKPTGDSRREFVKKGTLTAAILVTGGGISAGAATAQNGDELGVFQGRDYFPGADFDVLTEFGTGTKNDFMEQYDPDRREFGDPGNWDVYAIRIEVGETEGYLGHMLIDTDDTDVEVEAGDSGSMDELASTRNSERSLFETEVDI